MGDEVGFDGVTVREAIASRTLLGLDRILTASKAGELDFKSAFLAVDVLLDVTMPFCDAVTKDLLVKIHAQWKAELDQRLSAERELASILTDEPVWKL